MQEISKRIKFIYLSFSLFVGFSFVNLIIGNSYLESDTIALTLLIYIILTIGLYYYFQNFLKDRIENIFFNTYMLLSKFFVFGLVISAISLYITSNKYYTSAWKISMLVYCLLLITSVVIFSIKNSIELKKKVNRPKSVIIDSIDKSIKLVFILFFGYLITFLLGLFLFMILGLLFIGFGPEFI